VAVADLWITTDRPHAYLSIEYYILLVYAQELRVRLSTLIACAAIAGAVAVFAAVGWGAADLKRQRDESWRGYPLVQQQGSTWMPPDLSDEETGLRRQRAVYECVLRNAPRMGGKDGNLLERMCWEFPDLRQ
jgi:hypothetical protein